MITMMTLSDISSKQAAPKEETLNIANKFLDYATTHLDTIFTYTASDMLLAVHIDVSYLDENKARGQVGRKFFLTLDTIKITNNGAVINIAQIIKSVMTSTSEDELGAFFINVRETVPQRKTLE